MVDTHLIRRCFPCSILIDQFILIRSVLYLSTTFPLYCSFFGNNSYSRHSALHDQLLNSIQSVLVSRFCSLPLWSCQKKNRATSVASAYSLLNCPIYPQPDKQSGVHLPYKNRLIILCHNT